MKKYKLPDTFQYVTAQSDVATREGCVDWVVVDGERVDLKCRIVVGVNAAAVCVASPLFTEAHA